MKKGFTLIELLVVVAIIGVLATFVLAGLGQARNTSQVASRKVILNEMVKALEMYHLDHGRYPTDGIDPPTPNGHVCVPGIYINQTGEICLIELLDNGYLSGFKNYVGDYVNVDLDYKFELYYTHDLQNRRAVLLGRIDDNDNTLQNPLHLDSNYWGCRSTDVHKFWCVVVGE